jgi:putative NADH-flavin reductase
MNSNKIVSVFGASGRVGKEVVKLALLQGFKVKAHCRTNSKCELKHENLTVIKGEITNYDLVKEVVKESECVIIALGHRAPYKDIFCKEATDLIIKAMKELNRERLVCLSGAMIGKNEDNLTVPFRTMKNVIVKKYRTSFEDRAGQEESVLNSALAWTIVKPPRLVENGERRIFIYSETLKMGLSSSIGFDDLAEFLVEQIASKDYLHKSVYVKY